jgi:hypothetical protein
VRKKLRSTAQLLAHFLSVIPLKNAANDDQPPWRPRHPGTAQNLARSLITLSHPPGDFASGHPNFIRKESTPWQHQRTCRLPAKNKA